MAGSVVLVHNRCEELHHFVRPADILDAASSLQEVLVLAKAEHRAALFQGHGFNLTLYKCSMLFHVWVLFDDLSESLTQVTLLAIQQDIVLDVNLLLFL